MVDAGEEVADSVHQVFSHVLSLSNVRCGASSPESGSDHSEDTPYGIPSRLVFPHTHDGPSTLGQDAVRVAVPPHVRCDLLRPPRRISLRDGPVLWTPVPEATIDEHNDFGTLEHKVAASPRTYDRDIDPIAQSSRMQCSSQSHLWSGVLPALGSHTRPDQGRRGGWWWRDHGCSDLVAHRLYVVFDRQHEVLVEPQSTALYATVETLGSSPAQRCEILQIEHLKEVPVRVSLGP